MKYSKKVLYIAYPIVIICIITIGYYCFRYRNVHIISSEFENQQQKITYIKDYVPFCGNFQHIKEIYFDNKYRQSIIFPGYADPSVINILIKIPSDDIHQWLIGSYTMDQHMSFTPEFILQSNQYIKRYFSISSTPEYYIQPGWNIIVYRREGIIYFYGY